MLDNVLKVFNMPDVTTPKMQNAIRDWFELYYDTEVTKESDPSQRMAYVVVNKLCRGVFSEYTVKCLGAEKTLENLNRLKVRAVQLALVGGSCFIKPIPMVDCFDFVLISRDCIVPLGKTIDGKFSDVVTTEESTSGGKYYTLVERRTQNGALQIESRLYSSPVKGALGVAVPLSTLYPHIASSITLKASGIGLVELKTPIMNVVDGSSDGVAVYACATGLINRINQNERQISYEFENGQSRIIASADLMATSKNGKRQLNERQFVALDDAPENVGITIFSPTLREQSYLNRKNTYLRDIENQIGLKRGILSDVEAAERTATEITSTQGEYNLTIIDFQKMWADGIANVITLCGELAQDYHVKGDYNANNLVVDWGDGVLFNREKVWAEYVGMVQAGLLRPELALAWYFSLPAGTESDLERIRREYMPALDDLSGDS